jgi:hypothetical protein
MNKHLNTSQKYINKIKLKLLKLSSSVTSLNSNIKNYIVYKSNTTSDTTTISGGATVQLTNAVAPTTPTGYKLLFFIISASGNASVVPVGINTKWVKNTSSSSASVATIYHGWYIRNI